MSTTITQLSADIAALAAKAASIQAMNPPPAIDLSAIDAAVQTASASMQTLIASAVAAAAVTTPQFTGDPCPFAATGTLAAIIKFAGTQTIYAGMAIQVNATTSTLDVGDPFTARYQWNFGDTTPGSQFNAYDGWSAGHVYLLPGAYTISLTITSQSGKVSTATAQITVQPTTALRLIYISPTGNDANNGSSPALPIQSVAKLNQLLNNNTQVFFQSGQTFNLATPININAFSNVILTSYGTGTSPVLNFVGPAGAANVSTWQIITSQKGTQNLAISGLSFTSPFTAKNTPPNALTPQGTNIAVYNCTFSNLGDCFLLNMNPNGFLIQGCSVTAGLQGYFSFTQGSNIVIQGNTVPLPGSQYQHIVRSDGTTNLFIGFNNFSTAYGCPVSIQLGSYACISKNTLNGPCAAGPLNNTSAATSWCAWTCFDSNTITDSATGPLSISGAAWHTMLRNNLVNCNGQAIITIQAPAAPYNYQAVDVRILGNTGINTAGYGRFLLVQGPARGIALFNNLSIAPAVVIGTYQSCPVCVVDASLESFSGLGANIFGFGTAKLSSAASCVEILSNVTPWAGQGFLSAAAWNALPPHTTANPDLFENITLGPANAPTGPALAGGASIPGLYNDFNSKVRPATGVSIGAIQN